MKTRFTINVGDQQRSLFSIREVRNSENADKTDLNLHFRGGGRTRFRADFEELVLPADEDNYQPSHQHFSIHADPGRDTNLIKRTLDLGGVNNDANSWHITSGIKSGRFVPILFTICGNLLAERYDLPDTEDEIVSLGEFDPAKDQLRFMVIVSAADVDFPPHEEHPSNFKNVVFSDYRITLLWSYFNFPALEHSINIVPYTTKENGPSPGREWQEIYDLYTDLYGVYSDAYFKTHDP